MEVYKTIFEGGTFEQTIEKSKFIASISNVYSREEAEQFISDIRTKYKDATHNVPAFILGDKMELKWQSDDGEPNGTAGAPILRTLEMRDLTNICVVVTRYFGGIKLGTGGLVRAYTSSVQGLIENLGIAKAEMIFDIGIKTDYKDFNKIEQFCKEQKILIDKIAYEEVISFHIFLEVEKKDLILEQIKNLTKGKESIFSQEETIIKIRI